MENPYKTEQIIFNGKFKLITEDNEVRMSHWVKEFGIINNETGKFILDFNSSIHLDEFEEKKIH
jgi:hypothetical protein